jgi:hypothetical protein
MERGLLWLPTLAAFIWLARAGYREYRQVESSRIWAAGGERWKYDIYAVIRYKDRELAWGKPTVKEPIDIQTISVDRLQQVELTVDRQSIDLNHLPTKGKSIEIKLHLSSPTETRVIPFTSIPIAVEWIEFLQSV